MSKPIKRVQVKKLGDLFIPLIEFTGDLESAEKFHESDKTQFGRRVYVRSLFSLIEGALFLFKQAVLTRGSTPTGLTIAEQALLQEVSFELDEKGESREKIVFLRLENNLKFTIKMIEKIFECDLRFKTDTPEWQSFLESVRIRNRITHPKRLEDFNVSDDELIAAQEVGGWFLWIAKDACAAIKQRSR